MPQNKKGHDCECPILNTSHGASNKAQRNRTPDRYGSVSIACSITKSGSSQDGTSATKPKSSCQFLYPIRSPISRAGTITPASKKDDTPFGKDFKRLPTRF